MKINKAELQTALEIVKPGLANKEIIEQSTSFAFNAGRVITYNDEIGISHPIKGLDIQGAVEADKLYSLLSRITMDEIDIDISETEVILQAGKGRAGLPLQQEIKLPLEEIKVKKDWKESPDKFIEALKFVLFCCSSDMSVPVLTCVHITNTGILEACDNFRAIRHHIPKMEITPFLLPATSAKELIRHKPTYIAITEGWVHFKTREGTIFSCRVFQEKYMDITILFKVDKKMEIKLPSTLPEILSRAHVFAEQDFLLDEQVHIEIANNKMKVRGEGDRGWWEEETNIRYKESIPLCFSINPSFLQDSINKIKHCFIGKDKMLFEGEDWEHILALEKKE